MKRSFILITLFCLKLAAAGQLQQTVQADSTRIALEQQSKKWLDNLYEMGIDFSKDSFFVKEETLKLLKDETYRKATYPEKYTWPVAVGLMKQMELKKAFWHLMNLYQDDTNNKRTVLGTFVLYDSVLDMSKVLVSSFYTYAFADPRVCRITNNHPDIYRPDIVEKEQQTLKELVSYILYFRKQKTAAAKN